MTIPDVAWCLLVIANVFIILTLRRLIGLFEELANIEKEVLNLFLSSTRKGKGME
jgi:hypothetical protein